ncbi:MAG: PKD domain-containing protein [Candidatus Bipolaricaulota bacterium]|nr:PKD domain-containing protein [Candidatus Bipolaricaulota bacterium]
MRTTTNTARGVPLAVFLLFVGLVAGSGVALGEGTIQIFQTVDPSQIFVAGMGQAPETTNVSLVLQGIGATGERFPVDCMLVIDTSATAELAEAKLFALDLVDRMGSNDRVGVLSYAATARVALPLSKSRAEIKSAIGGLTGGDKSALGTALQLARRELSQTARPDATMLIVLFSDGQSNIGSDAASEGKIAVETGIQVTCVGIGTLINRALLEELAATSGGAFAVRPSDAALESVVNHAFVKVAASDVVVEKRIPAGLEWMTSAPAASQVRMEMDGSTTVRWAFEQIELGQILRIDMKLRATESGTLLTDDGSTATYRDFRKVEHRVDIAADSLNVVMPNRAPEAGFEFEPAAPTTADPVEFYDASRDIDGDETVAAWAWEFGDGTTADARDPVHRFDESGTYAVTLVVADDRGLVSKPYEQEIVIGNAAPTPSFAVLEAEFMIAVAQPRAGVEVILDASSSYDLDGRVVRYEWDFESDGVVDVATDAPDESFTFMKPGDYDITLYVTDDMGARTTLERTVTAVTSVTAVRTIETCLPEDRTVQGATVTITLALRANTTLNGLAVSETLPAGWTFRSVETDGAALRQSGSTAEWLFVEKFTGTGPDSQREIRYTLTAPTSSPKAESEPVAIRGSVGSSSPRLLQTITGEDRVWLQKYLSIPIVISRWNVETSAIDLCLREVITFDQIQYAVSLWLSGASVPYTNNGKIDLSTLNDLIAYWLTGSSVHDPLP